MTPFFFVNRYTIVASAIALTVAAGGFAYSKHRATLIQIGYDKAILEVTMHNADTMRELKKERSRQQDILNRLQEAYVKSNLQVAAFAERNRVSERLLHAQKRDFEQRLESANNDSLRKYAADVTGNLEQCRADFGDLAQEAASCSDVAHTLKQAIDVIRAN
jgi:hypothetical protein